AGRGARLRLGLLRTARPVVLPGGRTALCGWKRRRQSRWRGSVLTMGIWQTISSWWNKDARAEAVEETSMTQAERDVAEEDYEGRKDDVYASRDVLGGGAADYERDTEPPRDTAP